MFVRNRGKQPAPAGAANQTAALQHACQVIHGYRGNHSHRISCDPNTARPMMVVGCKLSISTLHIHTYTNLLESSTQTLVRFNSVTIMRQPVCFLGIVSGNVTAI